MIIKNKAYAFENGIITIDRDLTDLDIFVQDFLDILADFGCISM